MFTLPQSEGFYIFRRLGTAEDPNIFLEETRTVFETKVYLTELPSRLEKVVVSGEGITWVEVTNSDVELNTNEFYVNYRLGIVEFNSTHNNKVLNFSYYGTGIIAIDSSRVAVDVSGNLPTKTLKDVVDETTNAVNEFVHKGDYVSTTTYYPRNIVNYNGLMYINNVQSNNILPTDTNYWQKFNLDVMQFKIEERTSDPVTSEVGRIWLRTDL